MCVVCRMSYAPITVLIATPIGPIHLWGDESALHGARIGAVTSLKLHQPKCGLMATAADELMRYFAGTLQHFSVPLAPVRSERGRVLRHGIIAVPYGQVATYGALARQLDSGARAVGAACRTNPIPIFVPCHRIISANPNTSYYSGGDGPATKAWLLSHERQHSSAI